MQKIDLMKLSILVIILHFLLALKCPNIVRCYCLLNFAAYSFRCGYCRNFQYQQKRSLARDVKIVITRTRLRAIVPVELCRNVWKYTTYYKCIYWMATWNNNKKMSSPLPPVEISLLLFFQLECTWGFGVRAQIFPVLP